MPKLDQDTEIIVSQNSSPIHLSSLLKGTNNWYVFFYPISKAVFKVYNINYVTFSFDNCNKQNINNRNFNNFSQMIKFSTRKTKTQFESKLEKQTLSHIPQINRNQNAESRAILSGSVCMYGLSDSPLLVLEVCWLFLLQTFFLCLSKTRNSEEAWAKEFKLKWI